MKIVSLTAKIIIGVILVLVLAVLIFLFYYNREVDRTLPNPKTAIEIRSGDDTGAIAEALKKDNLISQVWVFRILTRYKVRAIKSGQYEIPANTTTSNTYSIITSGETKQIRVTIPEGYRTEQIAQLLDKKDLVNYSDFVALAKDYEGHLFPDTFFFPPMVTANEVMQKMLSDYRERTALVSVSDEDLIIASIVEREAIKDSERPLIAGIYKNRLAVGMKLQADPTVQYGKDSNTVSGLPASEAKDFSFWKVVGLSDYTKVVSEYNTYNIKGLPPAPICNPGLASIVATVNYQKSNYYYFLQSKGEIYPAKTVTEHNANKAKILGIQ